MPRTATSSRRAPTASRARFYDQGYGVRALYARLLDDAAHYPDTMDERRGAWPRLLALFRLVHEGDSIALDPARGGKLFDPAPFPSSKARSDRHDTPAPAPVPTAASCACSTASASISAGEKLSYRTLDVEQIGRVYETVMGFTVETRPGPALAIRAGKNNRTPVFVDVAALAATKGNGPREVPQGGGRTRCADRQGRQGA